MFTNKTLSVSIPETIEAWISLLVNLLVGCDFEAILHELFQCDVVALVPTEEELEEIVRTAIAYQDGKSLAALSACIRNALEDWASGFQYSIVLVAGDSGFQKIPDGSLVNVSVLARSYEDAHAAVKNIDPQCLYQRYTALTAENDDAITEDDGDLAV